MPTEADVEPLPTRRTHEILPIIFWALFLQLFLLIAVSFVMQFGPLFVTRFIFGLDFADFYNAAGDWLAGMDPYARGRLYTPPSSILVGLAFHWTSFAIARLLFFFVNIALVYASLRALSRQFQLTRANESALLGITAVFYPFYFLVERGNLDGIMLALLVFGFRSRNSLFRAGMVGASLAVKVYTGLMVLVLLRKRSWKVAGLAVLVVLLLQVPFAALAPNFIQAVSGRSELFRMDENISPAALFKLVLFAAGGDFWKLAFLLTWAATLLVRLLHAGGGDLRETWPTFVPWMISFPIVVYPYSGVLALSLVALIAAHAQQRKILNSEAVVLIGFGLLGFQAIAWTAFGARSALALVLIHSVCSLGTLLMLLGACWLPQYGNNAEAS